MKASPAAVPDVAVAALVARARAAQREFETWPQERVDEAVTAAAWAIVEPGRNRALAELAVRDTGLGDVTTLADPDVVERIIGEHQAVQH